METPKDNLKRMTAWDVEPTLTESDLDAALAAAALADKDGLVPTHPDWKPTYDLNTAATAAWLIKAARASPQTETEPGSGTVTSKIFDNCRSMARIYASKRSYSLTI